jgi:hypothetical protein
MIKTSSEADKQIKKNFYERLSGTSQIGGNLLVTWNLGTLSLPHKRFQVLERGIFYLFKKVIAGRRFPISFGDLGRNMLSHNVVMLGIKRSVFCVDFKNVNKNGKFGITFF